MIIKIESPNELKGGVWYRYFHVKDEAEALEILNGETGLLHESNILKGFTLFIETQYEKG